MGFLSRFRETTRGLTLPLLVAAAAAGVSLGARRAAADQVVPVVAALAGQQGSTWGSDLKVTNPYNESIGFSLVFTPRGQSMSAADPRVSYTLGPNETLVLEDVYHVGFPGQSGAARVLIQMDVNAATSTPFPDPVVDTAVYSTLTSGGAFGQSPPTYTTDQLAAATGSYRMIVGKDGERTNVGVTTGASGLTATVTAYGPAGDTITSKTVTLGPDAFYQWSGNPDGVAALLGTAVPANSTLDFLVTQGSGVWSETPVNNTTNDSRWKDATKYTQTTTQPQILGIDYNNDGIADNVDADHNGVLDRVINVDCAAPYPWEGTLVVSPPGTYNYFVSNPPQGLGIDSGTGKIVYDPPCSDAGQTFTPAFYVNGMTTSTTTQFSVR